MSARYRKLTWKSHDGLELFCREYAPAGEPRGTVVALPGLTRNSRDFAPLAERLATRYRVLTPDLRGRGRSQWDPNPANYHPGIYYQDVLKLLAEQTQGQVALIGTSLGGMLSMFLAAGAPERVAGIVLNDIGPEVAPEGLARIGGYVGRRGAARTWAEAAAQAKANYAVALPDLTDENWLAYARASYREQPDGTIAPDYDPAIGDALRNGPGTPTSFWPTWAQLARTPALAFRGETSDILSAATFDRMLAEKPDLLRVTVRGRGHVPLLNEPQVLEGLDPFLERLFA
jgi:pimeloyl-ACP methyl ester carboxylesterase